ncbi:probable mannitol dehydrogenase isoform X2 [Camellia sinensis]|uniref:probable mannitol dehydrogenase isoform X2 n=1 Tax=Camellia sinensis TaxID=4442 RepID=UPI001035D054|nr:probable mannitol dehydrogenase isoform X2 [Camellia sinensis]
MLTVMDMRMLTMMVAGQQGMKMLGSKFCTVESAIPIFTVLRTNGASPSTPLSPGGLGHVAVKFAKAFGLKVTVISTSPRKKKEAIEHLGADSFLISTDPNEMQAAMGTLDGIIGTVSAVHSLLPLLGLLKSHGKLVLVGAPEKPFELPAFPLLMGRKIVAGSNIGGMKETQEMIDFAGKHNITADIEVIPADYVNTAMERLAKADVKYRFVIDIGNTLKAA